MTRYSNTDPLATCRFHLFLAATFASATGRNGYNVACAWLLATSGNGVAPVATFFAITSIIEFLTSPIAGWLADHYDRRQLSMLADAFRVASAPFLGWLVISENPASVIWISSIVFTSCDRISLTATQSMIPHLGARFSSHSANCMNYLAMQMGSLAAAALIGLILYASTLMSCFFIIGAFFALSFVSMSLVRHPRQERPPEGETKNGMPQVDACLLDVCVTYSTLYVGGLLVSAVGANYVFSELGGNALDFGHLESSWSAGSILGAVLLIPLVRVVRTSKLCVAILMVTALSFAALSVSGFPLVLIVVGIVGVAYNLGRVVVEVSLQRIVSNGALGRSKGILHSIAVSLGLLTLAIMSIVSDAVTPSSIFLAFASAAGLIGILLLFVQILKKRSQLAHLSKLL